MKFHVFSAIADKLFDHIVSYLPFYYIDVDRDMSIAIDKLDNGSLRVFLTDEHGDQRFIEVPRSEIDRLLRL